MDATTIRADMPIVIVHIEACRVLNTKVDSICRFWQIWPFVLWPSFQMYQIVVAVSVK